MALNGEKPPTLSADVAAPPPPTEKDNAPKKRVPYFQICRTASLLDFTPADIHGEDYPSFKKPAICVGIYMVVGTLSFYTIRNEIRGKKTNDLIDAIYLCIVTMSTVGYGDLYPHSDVSELLASVFAFAGMAIVGFILSTGGHYLVVKQQETLFKTLHLCRKVGPDEALKEIEADNRLRFHKCIIGSVIMLVLMVVGHFILVSLEGLDFIDAVYCVCTTVTTVGFGDESFSTESGRFFAIFWISSSSTGLAQLFLYVAELFVGKKQTAMVQRILARRTKHVDLEAADYKADKVAGVADFIIDKLKEIGKISEEDISMAMKGFKDPGADQSRKLPVADIKLVRSS